MPTRIPPFMTRVHLYVGAPGTDLDDCHYVATAGHPPFVTPPDVLILGGQRIFIHDQDDVYREAFACAILPDHLEADPDMAAKGPRAMADAGTPD